MKTKIVVAATVLGALFLVAGPCGVYFFWHSRLAHASVASTQPVTSAVTPTNSALQQLVAAYGMISAQELPATFANSAFNQDGVQDGTVDFDANMLRTSNSAPAIHIKGPKFTDLVSLLNPNNNSASLNSCNCKGTLCVVGPGSPLMGKHICLTGWLKTSNVQNWAGAYLCIGTTDLGNNDWARLDGMRYRPIVGTTDWQQVKIVTDVPDQSCAIYFGPELFGPGEVWADDFQIALADPDDPITDDRAWRQVCDRPYDYSATADSANAHDGSPSLCFAYAGPDTAARKSWTDFFREIRDPDIEQYAGHTLRMSGWIKTEDVSNHVQPQIRPMTGILGQAKRLAKDSMVNNHSLGGTMNWTPFSVTCAIPKNTTRIEPGILLLGSGKVWIDTNSIDLEIVK